MVFFIRWGDEAAGVEIAGDGDCVWREQKG